MSDRLSDDEVKWRQVKSQSGLYVHRVESHVYPGASGWDESSCSAVDHAGCQLERRDLVVSGAVPRHQMRSYLKAAGIEEWQEIKGNTVKTMSDSTFRITATPEQWEKISEWVEQTKVER